MQCLNFEAAPKLLALFICKAEKRQIVIKISKDILVSKLGRSILNGFMFRNISHLFSKLIYSDLIKIIILSFDLGIHFHCARFV